MANVCAVPVPRSIREMVASSAFTTQAAPSVVATLVGVPPTGNCATTRPVRASTPTRRSPSERTATAAAGCPPRPARITPVAPAATAARAAPRTAAEVPPGSRAPYVPGRRRRVERRIVLEHRPLQALQLDVRIQTDRRERPHAVAVRGEGIRLPPRAIQRQHQRAAQARSQGLGGDQLLQARQRLAVAAGSDLQLEQLLLEIDAERRQPDRDRAGRLGRDVSERLASPLAERVRSSAAARSGSSAVADPRLGLQREHPIEVEACAAARAAGSRRRA